MLTKLIRLLIRIAYSLTSLGLHLIQLNCHRPSVTDCKRAIKIKLTWGVCDYMYVKSWLGLCAIFCSVAIFRYRRGSEGRRGLRT